MIYYAHSKKKDISAQEYSAHIRGVSSLAHEYARDIAQYSNYDKERIVKLAGKTSTFHDIGKLSKDNQEVLSSKKVLKSLPRNHVDAGAAYFLNENHFSGFSAAIIQAHHIGFPDFPDEMNKGEAAFRDVSISSGVDRELPELEAIHSKLIETHFDFGNEDLKGNRSVFLRQLLSCLVDADHTDTAMHYKQYPANRGLIELRPMERLAKLDGYIAKINQKGADNSRNTLRNKMYDTCRNACVNSSISSCDSPVGSGKTTALMAHLLMQAQNRGLRRIFVVLPFTNIIKQSVDIYRNTLVLPGENAEEVVAELHHRADFEHEDTRYLTALWRAPIIVTTAVAFFETLASNSPATLRRLHELPGSAIFVDESHAVLPAKLLPLAWKWINVYAAEWDCYWALASGSLSRFWTIPEIGGEKCPHDVPEIVGDELRRCLLIHEKERIVYKSNLESKSTTELVDWIVDFPGPRLVILNTVQSAAVVANHFAERYGKNSVEHLSTALVSNDRNIVLERVFKRLGDKTDSDWTLIATSCVEAGMDMSFRTGFRELGSLVSLLQASGRVNRENIYNDSEMWTFCIAEDGMLKVNLEMKNSAAVLRGYLQSNQIICPELSTKSIADEIALYGISGKPRALIDNESIQKFTWVEKEFKVIDSDTRLTIVDPKVANGIRYGKIDWRELQKVSIQIAKYKLEEVNAPIVIENIYKWDLGYDNFLGYMAGIIKFIKFEGKALIT